MKEYKNSFDKTAKIATVFTLIGLSGMLFLTFYFQNLTTLVFTMIFVGLVLTILIPALYFPRTYYLSDNAVIIKRPYKDKVIPYSNIHQVVLDHESLAKKSIRLMGSGGFFGYFGLFRNEALGRFYMYCSRLDHHVIIRTEKNIYVLSPDEDAAFVSELSLKIKP